MQSRAKDLNRYFVSASRLITGTLGSAISYFAMLPARFVLTKRQLPDQQSYSAILRQLGSRQGFQQVYARKDVGLKISLYQSFAFLGVGNLVLERYQDDGLFQRGLKAGLAGALVESALTPNIQRIQVASWAGDLAVSNASKVEAYRCMEATFFRNIISTPMVFISYLYIREQLKQKYHLRPSLEAAFAGTLSAASVEPLLTPLHTLHTRILANPAMPILTHVKQGISQSPLSLWRSGLGRIASKSLQSFVSFGLVEAGNRLINKRMEM